VGHATPPVTRKYAGKFAQNVCARRILAQLLRACVAFGVLALTLALASLPAGADQTSAVSGAAVTTTCSTQRLVLFSPRPGDLLTPGNYVVQGQAVDTAASTAPSVDRVQVFWDQSRDNGGLFLGGADSLSGNAFKLTAQIPKQTPGATETGTHTLFVYARSALSGQEQVLTVSVQLIKPLTAGVYTPTPTPPPAVLSPPPCAAPTPTPTFPPFPAPPAGAVTAQTLTLSVSNPRSEDALSKGFYVISGVAYDSSAQGTSGVDRVAVYLDPRDSGGEFLGDATLGDPTSPFNFSLLARLPDASGGHNLTVYARSAVTGQETSVTIPIAIL
jgi:hypothetical protein